MWPSSSVTCWEPCLLTWVLGAGISWFVSTVHSHHPWSQSPSCLACGPRVALLPLCLLPGSRVAPGPRSQGEAQDEESGHVMWDPPGSGTMGRRVSREHVSPKLGVDGVLQEGRGSLEEDSLETETVSDSGRAGNNAP